MKNGKWGGVTQFALENVTPKDAGRGRKFISGRHQYDAPAHDLSWIDD
jgi:hypothetical protein